MRRRINPNCKRSITVPLRTSSAILAVALLFVTIGPSPTAVADRRSDDTKPEPETTEHPPFELSLPALFHPDDEKDFDGNLPATHWIQPADGPSRLLIKRDGIWMRVGLSSEAVPTPTDENLADENLADENLADENLADENLADENLGTETPWPVVDQLASQLHSLVNIEADRARKIANLAVPKMKSPSETLLVKIDKALAIVSPDDPARWLTQDGEAWKNATVDPTARRVAYTRDGDLFVVDTRSGLTIRLTHDASDTLLDGILDWTYQEEIFGRGNYKGFWFSPDGEWLAMLQIDISLIEPYTLADSASPRGAGIVRRYSKAGDPIPQAKLLLWDLRQSAQGRVPAARVVEQSTPSRPRLITGVWWRPEQSKMLFCVSNRLQTWRETRSIDASYLVGKTTQSELLMREESPAWVEPPTAPGWLADGSFIWQSDLPSGRSRLYHVAPDGSVVRPVTPEDFDVAAFHVSADGQQILVSGDRQRGSIDRHVYRVTHFQADNGVVADHPPTFQKLTDRTGWHDTNISPDGQWFVDRYSTPSAPPVLTVHSTSPVEADDPADSAATKAFTLAATELQTKQPIIEPQLFQIQASGDVLLPALLVKPPLASKDDRAPVVVEVYGGPRAPVVSSRWASTRTLYRELLARRGIATLVVDNRSSAGRGIADAWTIRGRFGEVEMKDLETAVQWLHKQDWVDADRLAIRGWSYGGYMTLYAMTHSDAFAAGIAGGSVTDFREYDSIYTERYMGLPADNAKGYDSTSLAARAKELHGRLMLIHGESDDNVHPSNTMRMAKALQDAGKDFDLMIYPGAKHGISDPRQAWHLAQMTDRFLIEVLLEKP